MFHITIRFPVFVNAGMTVVLIPGYRCLVELKIENIASIKPLHRGMPILRISSVLSHEVRAKNKIVPLRLGLAFLVRLSLFLPNFLPFPCYVHLL